MFLFIFVVWLLLAVGSFLGSLSLSVALLISRLRHGRLYWRWGSLLGAALLSAVATGAMDAFFLERLSHAVS